MADQLRRSRQDRAPSEDQTTRVYSYVAERVRCQRKVDTKAIKLLHAASTFRHTPSTVCTLMWLCACSCNEHVSTHRFATSDVQHTRVKQNMEVLEELRAAGDLATRSVITLKKLCMRCNIVWPGTKIRAAERLR